MIEYKDRPQPPRRGPRRSKASSLELFNRRAEDGVEVNDDDHMLRQES